MSKYLFITNYYNFYLLLIQYIYLYSHGAFNVWDRQSYLQKHTKDGPTVGIPMFRYVQNNFIIGSHQGYKSIDHDDGTSYFKNSHNLLVYGHQKIKGYIQSSNYNLVLFPNTVALFLSTAAQFPTQFEWRHNVVVSRKSKIYDLGFVTGQYCKNSNFVGTNNTNYVSGGVNIGCIKENSSKNSKNMPDNLTLMKWSAQKMNMPQNTIN